MEIDFLITENNKIAPIEVKSANYRFHSSLDKFRKKFSNKIGASYILYQKDVMQKDGVWHLPLYMALFLWYNRKMNIRPVTEVGNPKNGVVWKSISG